MKNSIFAIVFATAGVQLMTAASAQGTFDAVENRSFASENAILDTSVPFAIGAREAQQALRGSFGWPNFQEGLVEGVYFRFDPDGYARFAPTPRLDVDVFEVICRPRTYSCAARKDGLEMFLNDRRQVQLKLENVVAGDTFHIVEGVSEIQIPERVLQPLDLQLETLLASGGDLSARRGGNEIARVSLKGFSAVTSYLRWIAARQDYAVLPAGWPVPNGRTNEANATVTQVANWASPMPQPQILATEAVLPSAATSVPNGEAEVLRAEIAELKRLLMHEAAAPAPFQPAPPVVVNTSPPPAADVSTPQVQQLIDTIAQLQSEVATLRTTRSETVEMAPLEAEPVPMAQTIALPEPAAVEPANNAQETAKRLGYLMEELGLDMQTAVTVIQLSSKSGATPVDAIATAGAETAMTGTNVLYQTDVVDQILAELEAEIAQPAVQAAPQEARPERPTQSEYQLLSRYFASVALPALQEVAAEE